MLRRLFSWALVLLPCACASAPAAPVVAPPASPPVDLASAREHAADMAFAWSELTPETLERARRERRFVLLHGAAAWCHFCHVMEEVTYRDPRVGALLRERFLPVRVDIDARPDIAERYGDYGWPATIVLSPDAEELGKYRGFVPPEEFLAILQSVGSAPAAPARDGGGGRDLADQPAPLEALAWIGARAAHDLDAYWDPDEGGWGRRQKAPIGANLTFEARRAAHGDAEALERARLTVAKQRALIDPVWGGIYQYSAASTWASPHFEKLMTYQAANMEAYAAVYARTKDVAVLADLEAIERYVARFLTNAEGAFLVSQDADVGGHDHAARFVEGRAFYAKGDADRRAIGAPRVDDHVYAFENGLAIAALAAVYEATGDAGALARARRAADVLLRSHVAEDGRVAHDAARPDAPAFLPDAASLGRGLARLAEVTGEPRYRDAALSIARAMQRDLGAGDGFFGQAVDPRAAGVFALRRKPFTDQVLAARFLCALARVTRDASWTEAARRALAAAATPRALDDQGRMLGELLLALDETGELPW